MHSLFGQALFEISREERSLLVHYQTSRHRSLKEERGQTSILLGFLCFTLKKYALPWAQEFLCDSCKATGLLSSLLLHQLSGYPYPSWKNEYPGVRDGGSLGKGLLPVGL